MYLLILPTFFAYYLFWLDDSVPLRTKVNEETGEVKVFVIKNDLSQPNALNSIRKVFQAPFSLSHYEICLKNKSRLQKVDEITEELVDVENSFLDASISLESDVATLPFETLAMAADGRACFTTNTDVFTFNNIDTDLRDWPGKPYWKADVMPSESARLLIWDKLSLTVIFIIAWWSLVLLIKNLYAEVRRFV